MSPSSTMLTTSKRILIFSTAYLPFIGGAEVAVKEITDRILDVEFDLITAKLQRGLPFRERIGNITVYRLGIGVSLIDKLILPFEGALFVRYLRKKKEYIGFWCVMVSFASGAAYIHNYFSPKKIPIILTLQEGDSEEHLRYRWLGLINLSWKLAFKYTSTLTVISTYLLDRAKRLGYEGKAEIIPNGVNIKKFQSTNPKRQTGDIALITVSRLVKKNAIGDIIESLRSLPDETRLEILGTGTLEKVLKSKVENLKLEDRVKFLGNIPNNAVPAYLHKADVFVRPSLSEGQGISFIEAMAAGIPVIATPVGGIPDFLKDGETGVFCEVNNPKSIARQVRRLMTDGAFRHRIVENAKQMVKEKYDWDLIASDMKSKVFDTL